MIRVENRFFLGELVRRTFGLRELALLDARLESLVEHGIELCLGSKLDLVVGLDIFLDRLTTIEGSAS